MPLPTPPSLTYLIGSLDRILRRELGDALVPLGLTLAQFTALSVLEARGKSSNAELAVRSFITPQSANEVISVMVARNWISREADPGNRRIVLLCLTDAGRAVLQEGIKATRVVEERMLGGIAPGDASLVHSNLEVFVRNLRR